MASIEVAASSFKSAIPDKEDNLTYDMHNLIATDITPLDNDPKKILETARDNTQLLVNQSVESRSLKLTDLHSLSEGSLLSAPAQTSLPKEKPKTRWEKFAESKNIQKQKRGRLVWDDMTNDWVPRYGSKSAKNQELKAPIMEMKASDDPNEDPWSKKRKERALAKAKQKMREVRNVVEGAGEKLPTGVANLNADVQNRKKGKDNLKEASRRAQISTASYGRFDKEARGEKKETQPKKRKVAPMSANTEKERNSKILSRIAKPDVDASAAANAVIFDEEKQRSVEKGKKTNKKDFKGGKGGKGIGKKGGKGKGKK
uniref:Ribosome biogenesis regulatory protein n=1 Tax=Chromera velia CCMP2878 TaxID=1169474 RepID=A0A0G4GRQ3_9ALVE|eukprot:Cvel_23022.t1-p1 / transcript=Cvel_23022.t1 / gene=Cvel_23022 / organism=Chromera_velia_CCMP2878 / gene_product=Ribosome biogenesis regulatory protein homolog, putative / transcript_product=Ribosome biogenesis regulatory protein homolog, putative / location=Cvel_scaffold2325:9407-13104(-) / protein_length=314 / sequence_SO=supercontig / SO=protein_coding / is_pseudo=false